MRIFKDLPTQEELKTLFEYNLKTGVLTRKTTVCGRAKAGSVAGSINSKGYRITRIKGLPYPNSRIIYKWVTGGCDNTMEVDHIDRNPLNNKWCNLELKTSKQNNRNRGKRSDNKSGFTGVYWDKLSSKWCVTLGDKFLGRYLTKNEAIKVRQQEIKKQNYHPNHGR